MGLFTPPIKPGTGFRKKTRRGFTLVESMIASVVLAAAVVGIASLLTASAHQAMSHEETAMATALGRQLLEEIAAKPMMDPDDYTMTPGPESGEMGRADFDNVDDYHGLSETGDSISLLGGGVLGVTSGGYTRAVTVEYRASPNGAAGEGDDFALVTVRVTTPSKKTFTLSRLVGNIEWVY